MEILLCSAIQEDMSFNDAYYGGGMVRTRFATAPDMAVRDSTCFMPDLR
jgi:hypothetical protein